MLIACRRFDEALQLLDEILGSSPVPRAYATRYKACLLIATGDCREALALVDSHLRGHRRSPRDESFALAIRAHALLGLGDVDETGRVAADGMSIADELDTLEEGDAYLRLVHTESLHATGEREHAGQAIAEARDHRAARAAHFVNPEWRRSFLENIPEHRRIFDLAREWLGVRSLTRPQNGR